MSVSSTIVIFVCMISRCVCKLLDASFLIRSIVSNSPCLRACTLSVCDPRSSVTNPVKRSRSELITNCACDLRSVSCDCNCVIRVCCAVTQAFNARVVLLPNSPSLVTPITAWPSCILARSLLCSLFVVITIDSSIDVICAFSVSTAL